MRIGDIYKAPWGTYAILSLVPLVLRSLDTMNAAVMPCDGLIDPAYVATGEQIRRPSVSPQTGRSESVAPHHVASQVPLSTSAGSPTRPALVDTRCSLTLGGMRPGTGLCILPGRPTLWWRPCLTRTTYGGISHCSFLSYTTDHSLYCWECRPSKPWVVVVKKDRQYTLPELYELARSQSPPAPELSAATGPAPEFSGGRELLPVTPSPMTTPAPRPSIPLVIGTSPKDDVGGFARPRRPEYRPLTLEAWREELTERAAIIEYVGGFPRATAEQMARTMVPRPLTFTKGAHYVPDGENYWW